MTQQIASERSTVDFRQIRTKGLMAIAAGLLLLGLAGASNAAVGYGFFMVATLLLFAGCGLLAVFALTRWFETAALQRAFISAFWMGAWCYVLSVAALSGYFIYEALAGRIEWKYIIFGPAALAAIVILDVGIWRIIVQRNLATVGRYGDSGVARLWTRAPCAEPWWTRSCCTAPCSASARCVGCATS